MAHTGRLNERAVPSGVDSLWHVDSGWAVFAGPLGRNALHAHSTAVYLAGLYDTFQLRIAGGEWLSCRTAIIRAGVAYEFDMAGAPLSVLYVEPNAGSVDTLAPLVRNGEAVRGAFIGDGDVTPLRHVFEHRPGVAELRASTDDLLSFSRKRARRGMDGRVTRALETLQAEETEHNCVASAATAAGLSASRFQHLFTSEVGVPFRRYRRWQRLRLAIAEAVRGASLTHAAHAAGFADQAHFSRAFRATFGAPPSRGL